MSSRTCNRGETTPRHPFKVKRLAMDYIVADRKGHEEFRLGNAHKSSVGRPMLAGQKLTRTSRHGSGGGGGLTLKA